MGWGGIVMADLGKGTAHPSCFSQTAGAPEVVATNLATAGRFSAP